MKERLDDWADSAFAEAKPTSTWAETLAAAPDDVRAELAADPEAAADLRCLLAVQGTLRKDRSLAPPVDFVDRVMAKCGEGTTVHRPEFGVARWGAVLALAAALVIAFMALRPGPERNEVAQAPNSGPVDLPLVQGVLDSPQALASRLERPDMDPERVLAAVDFGATRMTSRLQASAAPLLDAPGGIENAVQPFSTGVGEAFAFLGEFAKPRSRQ
ncbi:MAG TPA: hypothetical protein VNC50_06555 [Planctomycetia bacterium]|nr:hypothetical protein [Planctomycetia bacterium]